MVLLENHIVDIELTAGLSICCGFSPEQFLSRGLAGDGGKRRRDRSCRLIEMFVGQKSGM